MVVKIRKYLVITGFGLLSVALCGCESVHYYNQAIQGQYGILKKRQPISEIMADPETPESLRERLAYILAVRQFAEPKTWCYPVVGCAAYRGYFSEKAARQYAAGLSDQGYEVYVAGVTAYSTLGWFEDPVLNTFIQYSAGQSAALIFHELAHQVLYSKGDTAFNESFATAVEQEGLKRWQVKTQTSHLYQDYLRNYRRQQQFIGFIMHYRRKLDTLYQSDKSTMNKREQKESIYSELRDEFDRLKTNKNGLSAYDNWMNYSLNNAKISSVAAYHDFVPAFQKMLAENEGDLDQFYKACRKLAQGAKEERHRILNTYLEN